jgi:AcrR family transcriptional regulator
MTVVDTSARIRAAALELFSAHGYEQTSLREIADQVGITKASLYYHYPSKQALLSALVEPLVEDSRAVIDEAERLEATPDNVRSILARQLDTILRERSLCGLLVRDAVAMIAVLAPRWEELLGLQSRMYAWLAGPDASPARCVCAMAALETLAVPLKAAGQLPPIDEDELRTTLLDAALAVLGLH